MHGWLWFNVVVTVGLFTVTGFFLVRRAARERRLTPELALYLSTLTLGWMEAVIDWGAFVYYAPAWPHFPTDWPIVRLIPILPLHIPLCYTWFFFGGAWLGVRLARAVTQRFPRLGMDAMLVVCGLVVGFALDAVVENFFISVGGLWTYTQTWGPLTLNAGADNQWPIYMGFAMALSIAPMTYLLGKRNDRGEDLLQVGVRRVTGARVTSDRVTVAAGAGSSGPPARARQHWLLYLLAWVLAVHLIYGVVSLGYAALRWTGVQDTVSTVKPYPDGPAWFDDDVTHPDDPSVDRGPIDAAVGSRSVSGDETMPW